MLLLKEHEACPLASTCKYNQFNTCQGALSTRDKVFECEYVVNGKIIEHGTVRNQLDQTGQMKIIME